MNKYKFVRFKILKNRVWVILVIVLGVCLMPQSFAQAPGWSCRLNTPPGPYIAKEDLEERVSIDIHNEEETPTSVRIKFDVTKKGRRVADATTYEIVIPPGGRRVTKADIPKFADEWWDPDLIHFPILPGGLYEACAYVYLGETKKLLTKCCTPFTTASPKPPRLISPKNGAEITESYPLFSWTDLVPPIPGRTFTVRVCEILAHKKRARQTPQEAIEANIPWFEKKDIPTTTFLYPLSARALEEGKEYAWQITAKDKDGFPVGEKDGKSEVWKFWYMEKPAIPFVITYPSEGDTLRFVVSIEDVAVKFLKKVDVSETSIVYISGPVKPGTVIRENVPEGIEATELKVPADSGAYYLFIIDDMPDFQFVHPMRYAWMEIYTGHIQLINASYRPLILEPDTSTSPFRIVSSAEIEGIQVFLIGGTKEGKKRDISHKQDAEAPEISKAPECQNRKFALVIDGGDANPALSKQNAKDAKSMADWLASKGFSIQRISQDWHNNLPQIKGKSAVELRDKLGIVFEGYAKGLQCCDNFFFYFKGHGDLMGMSLYDGGINKSGHAEYRSQVRNGTDCLHKWLKAFPKCAKVTIVIDACESGGAIPALQDLRNKLSKVVIITSCHEKEGSASGVGQTDSFTEDFMEGANEDHDGDGKVGDLRDRVEQAKEEGKPGFFPQVSGDPDHKLPKDHPGRKKGFWADLCILD